MAKGVESDALQFCALGDTLPAALYARESLSMLASSENSVALVMASKVAQQIGGSLSQRTKRIAFLGRGKAKQALV